MAGGALAEARDSLRRELRARRRALTPAERSRASAAVCAQIARRADVRAALASTAGGGVLAAYLALSDEIDLSACIREMLGRGVTVAVPRWNGETYGLARLPSLAASDLRVGPMGVMEPKDAAPVRPEEVSVWLVPGLAFTRQGGRLGYGGGWYDRLMAAASASSVRLGVAHAFQVVADLPQEPHDVRLTDVVTAAAKGVGLVLEGGAMRGLFTAGVLDVLMEHDFVFDGVVGVSAGACFGCNYKSRQPGRVIRYNQRFARDPRYCSWWSLLTTGDIFGADFCYRALPKELDPFDGAAYEANPCEFHLSVTDCETGQAVYRRLDRADDELLAWIRASASMPLVSRAVEIDGRRYLDGGLSDGIPLRYFETQGFARNLVVTTRPHGYRKFPSWKVRALKPLLRSMPAIYRALVTRHVWYNATLEYVDARVAAGAALLIAPEAPLPIARVCHDPARMERVYRLGRAAAERRLEEIRAFCREAAAGMCYNHGVGQPV
ncbi:MAG: 5-formyltetrahydrofolate cyclo-ligase [Kiritimatiellia bacterium]